MRNLALAAVFGVGLLAGGVASAEQYVDPAGRLTFDTPDPGSDPIAMKLTDKDLHVAAKAAVALEKFITEKKLDGLCNNYLHWDCTGVACDPEIWLTYYATDEEREDWAETYRQPLPPKRDLPREPF